MRKIILFASVVFTVPSIALGQTADNHSGKSASVTGWVLDSACAYTKGISKPIRVSCATAEKMM